jgi:arylsulfatase A-like enzyme
MNARNSLGTTRAYALGVTIALGAVGCDKSPKQPAESAPSAKPPPSTIASTPPPEPPKGPKGPMNVLLLTIDSLRADMPWTGYERPIAPNLTHLAERATVYTQAYSVSSYTAKSVGALLAGRYPSSLYRSGWFFTGYSDDNLFFPEIAQKHGVRTIGGHAHLYFGRGKNFDQGFDEWELVPGITFDAQTDNHVTSNKMTDLAIRLLGVPKNTAKRFFAWFPSLDPHDKYVTHEESPDFGKTTRDRYDSEVFFTDLHVGRLLDWAKKQPFFDNTVVIVSADHGEAFGEHGLFKHAFWLWEVLTRVPLLISGPGVEAQRIDERRSHIDLAPTILDLLGIEEKPDSFVGKSLVPEIFGQKKPDKAELIVLDLPEDSHNPPVRAVISGDYKLIVYGVGRRELYDIAKDPGELVELSKKEPAKLAEMNAFFDETWKGIPAIEPFGGMKLRGGRTANGPSKAPE